MGQNCPWLTTIKLDHLFKSMCHFYPRDNRKNANICLYWDGCIRLFKRRDRTLKGLGASVLRPGTRARYWGVCPETRTLINFTTQGFSPDHLVSSELCKQSCFMGRKKYLDSKGGNILHKFVVLLASWLDSNLHNKNKTKQNKNLWTFIIKLTGQHLL